MIEKIGYWKGFNYPVNSRRKVYRKKDVYIKDGIFFAEDVLDRKGMSADDRTCFRKKFGGMFFGDETFFFHCPDDYLDGILVECNGKDEAGVALVVEKYLKKRQDRKNAYFESVKKWRALREKFDGYVIGLDKKIDVYENGFSVRVVFSSDVTFAGKKRFLKENRRDFLRWVIGEIEESPSVIRRIGSMEFYRPVEIINMRSAEVEVKFDVKEVV